MPRNSASALMLIAIVAAILPPGYLAYAGSYVSLLATLLILLVYGWRERLIFTQPSAAAILTAIMLVTVTVPVVYHTTRDLLAPILILPMLSAIAIGLTARPAGWVPKPTVFATICLLASVVAVIGGVFEHVILDARRAGLGNNPIHYGSLAVMVSGLALIGVVGSTSPWRYVFLLGPVFGLAAAAVSNSRGPMVSAVAIATIGFLMLVHWQWRNWVFRYSVFAILLAGTGIATLLPGIGNSRVASIFTDASNIFHFTGGSDDIRVALYLSAIEVLRTSPIFGAGLGQIMDAAQALFPELRPTFTLDDLHADWANFSAMAGGLGLLAWILLLTSPLMLLTDARARQDRPVVLGTVLLFVGQLTLGASNATFGILPQTMVFAISLGYFLARTRRLATEAV